MHWAVHSHLFSFINALSQAPRLWRGVSSPSQDRARVDGRRFSILCLSSLSTSATPAAARKKRGKRRRKEERKKRREGFTKETRPAYPNPRTLSNISRATSRSGPHTGRRRDEEKEGRGRKASTPRARALLGPCALLVPCPPPSSREKGKKRRKFSFFRRLSILSFTPVCEGRGGEKGRKKEKSSGGGVVFSHCLGKIQKRGKKGEKFHVPTDG